MSITRHLANPDEKVFLGVDLSDMEPDWVSCNGTVGHYYAPDGKPVPEWREHLKDRLLPCVYLQLYNGSDVAGFGVCQHADDGLWYEYLIASCADHRQGPFPNARVDGTDMLGWVDWLSRQFKRGYASHSEAEEASQKRAAEYRKHAASRSYKKAMGLGRNENVDVQFLGLVVPWQGGDYHKEGEVR